MDMMMLRKMVMGQMASGAQYVKGTFTVPSDANSYKIQLGKTFNTYIYFIEMTETSKTMLMNSGQNANKTYMLVGIYPVPKINNSTPTTQLLYARVNPTSGDIAMSSNGNYLNAIDGSSITLSADTLSSGLYRLYRDYEYNYIIVNIDNI